MSTEEPLAVGFSDLRGFTSYTAERGDQEAFRLARTFAELVGQQVEQHGGRLLKTYGDGVMTSFEDAEEALRCARAMQEAVSEHNEIHEERPLSAGIGLTWGTAIQMDDDLFGHSVNFAKRIADVAKGGQIVVSPSLCERAGSACGFCFRDLGEREIKGLGIHRLFEFVWREEVANLCLADDSVNFVLTEDDRFVLEFAKPFEERLRLAQQKLLEEAERGPGGVGASLKRRLARRLAQSLPDWVESLQERSGMGVEHRLDQIEAGIDKGNLVIRLPSGRKLRFDKRRIDLDEARRFLEKVRVSQEGPDVKRPPVAS